MNYGTGAITPPAPSQQDMIDLANLITAEAAQRVAGDVANGAAGASESSQRALFDGYIRQALGSTPPTATALDTMAWIGAQDSAGRSITGVLPLSNGSQVWSARDYMLHLTKAIFNLSGQLGSSTTVANLSTARGDATADINFLYNSLDALSARVDDAENPPILATASSSLAGHPTTTTVSGVEYAVSTADAAGETNITLARVTTVDVTGSLPPGMVIYREVFTEELRILNAGNRSVLIECDVQFGSDFAIQTPAATKVTSVFMSLTRNGADVSQAIIPYPQAMPNSRILHHRFTAIRARGSVDGAYGFRFIGYGPEVTSRLGIHSVNYKIIVLS